MFRAMDGDRFRAGKRLWSAIDDPRLRQEYPDEPTSALAQRLRRSMEAVYARAKRRHLSKSAAYLAGPHACRLRRGDDVGLRHRFQKGHVPANKGLRRPGYGPGRMKDTQYKPGVRSGKAADHHMPVGSTRLVDGYLYRKVSDVSNVPYTVNWKPEHHLMWCSVHGQITGGHALIFRNDQTIPLRRRLSGHTNGPKPA